MRALAFFGALLWTSLAFAQAPAWHVRLSTPSCEGWGHASLARMVEAELRVLGHALTVSADGEGIHLELRLPEGCEAGRLRAAATHPDGRQEIREASLDDMEVSARPRAVAMLLADLVDAVTRLPPRAASEVDTVTDAERLTAPDPGRANEALGDDTREGRSTLEAGASAEVSNDLPSEHSLVTRAARPAPSGADVWWLETAGSFVYAFPDGTLSSGISLDVSRDSASSRFGFLFGGAFHAARATDTLGSANLRWGSARVGAKLTLGAGRVVFDGRLRVQVHLLRATADALTGAVAESAWGAAVDVALDARVRVALSSRIGAFAFVAPAWVPYGFVGTADGRDVLGYRDFVLAFGLGLAVRLSPTR